MVLSLSLYILSPGQAWDAVQTRNSDNKWSLWLQKVNSQKTGPLWSPLWYEISAISWEREPYPRLAFNLTSFLVVASIELNTYRKFKDKFNLLFAEKLLSPPVNGCRAHTPPPVLRHNLNPPTSLPPHTLPTPSLPLTHLPRRSHSLDALDSMIIIQYVENDDESGNAAGRWAPSSPSSLS